MTHAVVYDVEFLTAPGAPQRFWCGPMDPDPVVVQIGAVMLDLEDGFDIHTPFDKLVQPVDRFGAPITLDPLLTRLTGIDDVRIAAEGAALANALDAFAAYGAGARFWAWGKDEFNMMAISCYVAGIAPPLPAMRFGNACTLMLAAGVPLEEIHKTRSPTVPQLLGLPDPGLTAHDALSDARSVALGLQALLRSGRLDPALLRPHGS